MCCGRRLTPKARGGHGDHCLRASAMRLTPRARGRLDDVDEDLAHRRLTRADAGRTEQHPIVAGPATAWVPFLCDVRRCGSWLAGAGALSLGVGSLRG